MSEHICCPQCGSEELQAITETNTQTTGKNYSAGQGCLGYLMFGPLGLLCGSCGQGQKTTTTNTTYWVCSKCGKKFRHLDEIHKSIDSAKRMTIGFVVCAALTLVGAIILYASEQAAAAGGAIVAAVGFGGLALLGWRGMKKNEEELDEIESGMQKFKK